MRGFKKNILPYHWLSDKIASTLHLAVNSSPQLNPEEISVLVLESGLLPKS